MAKLIAEKRTQTGKKAKRLIKGNQLPAVFYNSSGESTSVQIPLGTIQKILQTSSTTTIIELTLDNKTFNTVITAIQKHPVTGHLQHISFFEIKPGQITTFHMPYVLKGTSPAVKNTLGVLLQLRDSVEVKCKLENLVPLLEIDIDCLEKPGDTVQLGNNNLPEGIELVHQEDKNKTIVTITPLQKLEEVKDTEDDDSEDQEDGQEDSPQSDTEGENKSEQPDTEENSKSEKS